jgi:hypothetical protein
MMPPVLEVIGRVRDVLAEQVLPELATSTWTAANIRSCVMLLTYIEDAIHLQPAVLAQANGALKEIIAAGLAADPGWLEAGMREQIEPLMADGASVQRRLDEIERDYLQLKAAAASIVKRSADSGRRDPAFQELLRARLGLVNSCELRIYENAAKLPPF